ncbi:MAG: TIGR03084 family metal-binding protein [Thermodesulfobacteriota bacterium]
MEAVCRELEREYSDLDELLGNLAESDWNRVTFFNDWTIRDEISHLAYYDNKARLAATDASAFQAHCQQLMENFESADAIFRQSLAEGRHLSPGKLMAWWHTERSALLEALMPLDPEQKLPWYGPPMTAKSFATARLMETWAHGQDIYDTLGIARQMTPGLQYIAFLGVKTFGWSFVNRCLEKPGERVYVELTGPAGEVWAWGESSWQNRVRGSALDFCLVVTKRRHVADTDLDVQGEIAEKWMQIAQAFAGPPAEGPAPGRFKPQSS